MNQSIKPLIIRSTLNLWTSSSLANLFPSGIQEWKKLGATDMLNDSLVIDDCRESTIKRNVPNNNTSKCCVTIGNEKIILWISKYFSSDSVGAPITSNNNRSFCWPKIPLGSLRRNFFNTDAIVCTENCSRFTRRPFYRMWKKTKPEKKFQFKFLIIMVNLPVKIVSIFSYLPDYLVHGRYLFYVELLYSISISSSIKD